MRRKGSDVLTGSNYIWLRNPSTITREATITFDKIRTAAHLTARARSIKESASHLSHYISRTWVMKQWNMWIRWARHSQLEPIKRVAVPISEQLLGIVNAAVQKTNNDFAESMNAKIQLVKKRA
jgi:transposase